MNDSASPAVTAAGTTATTAAAADPDTWAKVQAFVAAASPWVSCVSGIYSIGSSFYTANKTQAWQNQVDAELRDISIKLDRVLVQLDEIKKLIYGLPDEVSNLLDVRQKAFVASYKDNLEVWLRVPAKEAGKLEIDWMTQSLGTVYQLTTDLLERHKWRLWFMGYTAMLFRLTVYRYLLATRTFADPAEHQGLHLLAVADLEQFIKYLKRWVGPEATDAESLVKWCDRAGLQHADDAKTLTALVGKDIGIGFRRRSYLQLVPGAGSGYWAGTHFILQGDLVQGFSSATPGKWVETDWMDQYPSFTSFADVPYQEIPGGGGSYNALVWPRFGALTAAINERRARYWLNREVTDKMTPQIRDMQIAIKVLEAIHAAMPAW